MKTKLFNFTDEQINGAAELIRQGKLVAFPTETVYGLGANALDEEAVKSTYVAKGRPIDNPEIVHVWCMEQIETFAYVDGRAKLLIEAFMPGSLTLVVKKKANLPSVVTAGFDTVAVRMPQSQQARQFLKACQVPVAAPSANTSGRPSPTTWKDVKEDLDGKIDGILCGEDCSVGIESTVLDTTRESLVVLRPGVVTPSQIAKVVNQPVTLLNDPNSKVNSPGVRYTHYAPLCQMVLNVDGDKEKLASFYDKIALQGLNPVLLCDDVLGFGDRNVISLGKTNEEVAQKAFSALRFCEKNFDYIICSFLPSGEFGQSIQNRLMRSASNKIL